METELVVKLSLEHNTRGRRSTAGPRQDKENNNRGENVIIAGFEKWAAHSAFHSLIYQIPIEHLPCFILMMTFACVVNYLYLIHQLPQKVLALEPFCNVKDFSDRKPR